MANQIEKDKFSAIPEIFKIKDLELKNYKAFDNYSLSFTSGKGKSRQIKDFICFIGPNGNGKTTALDAILMLFSNLDNYEKSRIVANLSKGIRHVYNKTVDNFSAKITVATSDGDYKIEMDKTGFVKNHPKPLRTLLHKILYYAKFDQELNKFQLPRNKWESFRELFEAVTGFKVEEVKNSFFGESSDPRMNDILKNYVLDFKVIKPYETISVRECSAGERKIIKSFSTLLTLEYTPKVILVDNIEMHVDRLRHISLISAMKKCFPDSQIISTTHSYYIKALGENAGIYDTRMARANNIVKKQSWRFTVSDEVDDCIMKLKILKKNKNVNDLINEGKIIQDACTKEINDLQKFRKNLIGFLSKVSELFVTDICN